MSLIRHPLLVLLCLVLFLTAPLARAASDENKATDSNEGYSELKPRPGSLPRGPGFGSLGTLGFMPSATTVLTYGGWIAPQKSPTEIDQHRLTLQVPIYRDDAEVISLSAGASSLHFGEAQALSGSNILVPQDLWKIEFGGGYMKKLEDDKMVGGRLSLGSASDHPFASFNVTTIGASAFYSWKTSEASRWILSVLFSNNNPILNYVPIPGVIYMYQTPKFTGMFGFPFSSILWSFAENWTYSFSFFGPTINSEVAYGNPREVQVFTGFNWLQQSYLREARPDPKERLYFDEKHASLGVRFPLVKGVRSDLQGGYAFDRSLYEGQGFRKKDDGEKNLDASWYAAWNFKIDL